MVAQEGAFDEGGDVFLLFGGELVDGFELEPQSGVLGAAFVSEWIGELLAAEPSETWGHWKIRHFLIYLDGAGAYEVAAEDVEWLPEEAAP